MLSGVLDAMKKSQCFKTIMGASLCLRGRGVTRPSTNPGGSGYTPTVCSLSGCCPLCFGPTRRPIAKREELINRQVPHLLSALRSPAVGGRRLAHALTTGRTPHPFILMRQEMPIFLEKMVVLVVEERRRASELGT